MKICEPNNQFFDLEQVKLDLQKFIIQDEPLVSPPCAGCQQHLPDICSPKCPEAPKSLSVDPIQYPIERSVVALVFELNAIRLFETCWSCEGHIREGESQIWKIPQVCFYSQSSIYAKLLSTHLSKLFIQKKLKYNWLLCLSDISQSIHPAYNIQPDLTNQFEPSLGLLQNDMRTIGNDLQRHLKAEARSLLTKITAIQ